jgi:hypothetical protein
VGLLSGCNVGNFKMHDQDNKSSRLDEYKESYVAIVTIFLEFNM